MLSGLRLRLTGLYLLVGLAFLVLVSAGSYGLLRDYYETSTDLALQHRLVEELRHQGAAVPNDLATADQAWYASRGRVAPPLPSPGPVQPAPVQVAREGEEGSGSGKSDEGEEGSGSGKADQGEDGSLGGKADEGENGTGSGKGRDGGERGDDHPSEGPAGAGENELEESYDSELATIFLRPLGADGRTFVIADLGGSPSTGVSLGVPAALANVEAVSQAITRALEVGLDWRTIAAPDGTAVRLLTSRVEGGAESRPAVLQLGRPLADQERVLRRLLAVLLGLGGISAVLLGLGGWWLAGRSLRPAELAFRQQQAFIANASHELRTPLTLIRASTEVLARSLPPSGDHRLLIEDILAECDHTSGLVSDLLLLSRLDSSGLDLRREPVALDGLWADLARQFGRLAEQRGVTFSTAGSGGVALADPIRLRQVLLALLDNALRHTAAGGTITLEATKTEMGAGDPPGMRERGRSGAQLGGRNGRHLEIAVTDTGSGIAPEHLPHVFERFYRPETSSAGGGAGLGLAVAKSLVEVQGGHIRMESRLGRGTRVTVRLPAR